MPRELDNEEKIRVATMAMRSVKRELDSLVDRHNSANLDGLTIERIAMNAENLAFQLGWTLSHVAPDDLALTKEEIARLNTYCTSGRC